jgi:hypothetical protein
MKPPPRPPLAGAWLPAFIALFFAATSASCSKLQDYPPIPLPKLQSFEQFPIESWMDSVNKSTLYQLDPQIGHEVIYYPPDQPAEYGQAILTIAFRTSVPGAVTSLAILEPAAGYAHTVYLWDSATGALLASANISTVDSGRWASVSLALNGQEVPILANHGYVLGFNSLAISRPLNDATNGEEFYGIFLLGTASNPAGLGQMFPLEPFTSKSFTFEAISGDNYDSNTPITNPPWSAFYPGQGQIFGPPDIGFVPEPQ